MLSFSQLGSYGRLGNQLFQIASSIGIATENNDVAAFPRWFCNYTQKDMSCFFKNPIRLAPADFKATTYQEPSFEYSRVTYTGNLNLHGYYQSELYFKHCEETIRELFQPSDEVIAKLSKKYVFTGQTCSVHVRRGDYVNNKVHDVCDLDYYNRAIKYVKEKANIQQFVIFSDDIAWCRNNFKGNFTFVEGNHDIEDLFLMSTCDHNIIANSSFSWWGSWLNKNPDKLIISPTNWFGRNEKDAAMTLLIPVAKDIYTKNMIKL
jgi:hypothetical protein